MDLKITVRKKMMDLMAVRDHSEQELRAKLEQKFHGADDASEAIEAAIEYAQQNNWLGNPAALSEKTAEELHRKHKGILFINNYLEQKCLPPVLTDDDLELEKALHLVKNKYREEDLKYEADRIARFLTSRGFDTETVRKVIYEKL